jgi:hypothetical protein
VQEYIPDVSIHLVYTIVIPQPMNPDEDGPDLKLSSESFEIWGGLAAMCLVHNNEAA